MFIFPLTFWYLRQKLASSSTFVVHKKDEELIDWSKLPTELTSLILAHLSVEDVLQNAQRVCTLWREASTYPLTWRKRKIHFRNPNWVDYDVEAMVKYLVHCNQDILEEIMLTNFVDDSLLAYIAERSSKLRRLSLVLSYSLTDKGFTEAVAKLPLLEEVELEVWRTSIDLDLRDIGYSCPRMKTLKLTYASYSRSGNHDDDNALAIAVSMPNLRHLQLIWNKLSDTGLTAILDNCPYLEHLDLRQCLNVKLSGNLKKRCLKKLKVFKRPGDSTAAS